MAQFTRGQDWGNLDYRRQERHEPERRARGGLSSSRRQDHSDSYARTREHYCYESADRPLPAPSRRGHDGGYREREQYYDENEQAHAAQRSRAWQPDYDYYDYGHPEPRPSYSMDDGRIERGYHAERAEKEGGWGSAGSRYRGYPRMGGHYGKGPQGYARTDERLREIICERLAEHDGIDASDIEVEVRNGEVTLRGTVDTRVMKYEAEECAEHVMGVRELDNRIKVRKSGESPPEERSEASSASSDSAARGRGSTHH